MKCRPPTTSRPACRPSFRRRTESPRAFGDTVFASAGRGKVASPTHRHDVFATASDLHLPPLTVTCRIRRRVPDHVPLSQVLDDSAELPRQPRDVFREGRLASGLLGKSLEHRTIDLGAKTDG